MNKEKNYPTGSTTNSSTNTHKSKEIIKEKNLREIYNRNLDKNIYKLCSEADLRVKVLLSNVVSGVTSSSKLSSKGCTTFKTSYPASTIKTPVTIKSVATTKKSFGVGTAQTSDTVLNIPRPDTSSTISTFKDSYQDDGSFHFNTEIDFIDDPTNKQLTVAKILKLRDLGQRMEKRQNFLIKSQLKSSSFKRSYISGLEEGFRYGYLNNPVEHKKSEIMQHIGENTYNEIDKSIINQEMKDERMRGGEDPSKHNQLAISNEYPTDCTENVNLQDFNKKYAYELGFSTKDLSAVDQGGQYLQHFEKMLKSVGEGFAKGFRAGFGNGFVAANIFLSIDTTFTEDEKEYISQMRKCLKFYEDDFDNDTKKIYARTEEMKRHLNIPDDEFEDITQKIVKGVIRKIPLKFSRNDYKYYTEATKRDYDQKKNKSVYEESDTYTSLTSKDVIFQHTQNRASKYIMRHKINDFFQFLGSHLVSTKPEDPISFLINILDKCIEYRFNEFNIPPPLLFTRKHVESVYHVLDPMHTGYINLCQYAHGMEAVGVRDLEDLKNFRPGEKIDKYIFISNACHRLLNHFREMISMDVIPIISTNT